VFFHTLAAFCLPDSWHFLMPRKRKQKEVVEKPQPIARRRTTEEYIPPPEEPISSSEFQELPQEMQLALSQVEEKGGSIVIFKRNDETGKYGWLKRLSPSDFKVDEIADNWGGGEYAIKFYDDEGGLIQVAHHSVDASIVGRQRTGAPPPGTDASGLLAVMQAQNDAANSRFEALLKVLLESKPSEQQIIDRLKVLKDFVSTQDAKPSIDPSMMFQMFKAGLDLARESKEVETKGGGLMDVGERVIAQMAEKLINQFMASKAQPGSILPQKPGLAVAQVPASSQQLEQAPPSENPPANGEAKAASPGDYFVNMIPYLIVKAGEGSDPSLYAEWIVDNLPGSMYQQTFDFLNRPALFDDVTLLHPAVGKHRAWFDSLLRELINLLSEQLAPSKEPEVVAEASNAPGTDS